MRIEINIPVVLDLPLGAHVHAGGISGLGAQAAERALVDSACELAALATRQQLTVEIQKYWKEFKLNGAVK